MSKTDSRSHVPLPSPISFEGNIYENFRYFKDQWKHYCIASGLDKMQENVIVSTLFLTIGRETFTLLHNNLNISKEDQNSIERIFEILEDHFKPKVNIVWERYVFNQATQKKDESPGQYLDRLKKLAAKCDYKDDEIMIRDRFIAGLQDAVLGKELASDSFLTLENASFKITLSRPAVNKESGEDIIVEKTQGNNENPPTGNSLQKLSEKNSHIIVREVVNNPQAVTGLTRKRLYESIQENESFTTGSFIVVKENIGNWPVSAIWKITGPQFLQMYQACVQDGKFWYKCTTVYQAWNSAFKSNYYPVQTESRKIFTEKVEMVRLSEESARKIRIPTRIDKVIRVMGHGIS